MFCPAGGALLYRFEVATQRRAEPRDDVLRAQEHCAHYEERLYKAKEIYGEAFVDWVAHRACCIDCRAASLAQDLAQFASL
jgi:hypothetical protein